MPGTFLITLFCTIQASGENGADCNLKILNNNNIKYQNTFHSDHWGWNTSVVQRVLSFNKNDSLKIQYTTSNGWLDGTAYCTIEKIS